MLRAVIFDFDGVITDSEILHFRAFNAVLAGHDVEITKKSYYKNYLGFTDSDCFKTLVNEGKLKVDETGIEKLIEQKNRVFQKLANTEGKIIEGVPGFLETLQKNNIAIAICSGALLVEIELILDDANLRDFFEVIVSADHVKKGKPSPEGFLLTLEKLNKTRQKAIKESQCIVIEDSHWGLKAAKAAGMHTIAITNSYDANELDAAEMVVDHLDQLTISQIQELCS